MKRILFGIFAHPDDEAFGPSAFLYQQAQSGTDIHLILLTDGDAGQNHGYEDLAATRLAEWQASGDLIGVKSNFALHYPDGGLCNNLYLEICGKILERISEVLAGYSEPLELSFITFEERGITGHLDHIAASFMTTYIFEKLKAEPPANCTVNCLRYYCLPKTMIDSCNCDWLYMPAGREGMEIDEIVDYQDHLEQKIQIMSAHVSQKHDMDYILSRRTAHPDKNICDSDYFIVRK